MRNIRVTGGVSVMPAGRPSGCTRIQSGNQLRARVVTSVRG